MTLLIPSTANHFPYALETYKEIYNINTVKCNKLKQAIVSLSLITFKFHLPCISGLVILSGIVQFNRKLTNNKTTVSPLLLICYV
jgi:hypothetical protein